jgi:hypothetical protein
MHEQMHTSRAQAQDTLTHVRMLPKNTILGNGRNDTLPVLAERLDRVLTVRTQLTTCRGILGTVAMSIEC